MLHTGDLVRASTAGYSCDMQLSRATGHPYQAMAAEIVAKVKRGELRPGDRLPSVRALAKEYGVTTTTAQKAVRQLAEDGYATTVQGLGVFVREPDPTSDRREAVTTETLLRQLDELQATVEDLVVRLERLEQAQAERHDR